MTKSQGTSKAGEKIKKEETIKLENIAGLPIKGIVKVGGEYYNYTIQKPMKTTENDSTIAGWEKEFADLLADCIENEYGHGLWNGEGCECSHCLYTEATLINFIAQALQRQHESDIQAFEKMLRDEPVAKMTADPVLPMMNRARNQLRAELRQKLKELK